MLMTKLKVYGVAAAALLLGAGGLAYRAGGQELPSRTKTVGVPGMPAAASSGHLTELDLLRREVEILKLQMEVVQAELRSLKGWAGPGGPGGPMLPGQPGGMRGPTGAMGPGAGGPLKGPQPGMPAGMPPGGVPGKGPFKGEGPAPQSDLPGQLPQYPVASGPGSPPQLLPARPHLPPAGVAEKEVEDAWRAFRQARESGDAAATHRAAAALEKALRRFRTNSPPTESRGPQ
jgi:hypothetical protein